MVVLARLHWLQQQALAGRVITTHFSFNAASQKDKVTFRLGGWNPASPASALIPAAISLVLSSASAMIVVDRGHKHSDGFAEVSFWLHRPTTNGRGQQAETSPYSLDTLSSTGGHDPNVDCLQSAGGSRLRADAPEFLPVDRSAGIDSEAQGADVRKRDCIAFLLEQPEFKAKRYSFRHAWTSEVSSDSALGESDGDCDDDVTFTLANSMQRQRKRKFETLREREREHAEPLDIDTSYSPRMQSQQDRLSDDVESPGAADSSGVGGSLDESAAHSPGSHRISVTGDSESQSATENILQTIQALQSGQHVSPFSKRS
eukprot:TRINITY_DN53570_c0_g1_i1.p1 TRINITY_DN53570_c0_g1~~TRINITY_DN53570_c0_g1_i1.p1  ORF type:complete len:340 (-),score=38.54 TRINITY_DN53570_c0_g1_i1:81-1028(-)